MSSITLLNDDLIDSNISDDILYVGATEQFIFVDEAIVSGELVVEGILAVL